MQGCKALTLIMRPLGCDYVVKMHAVLLGVSWAVMNLLWDWVPKELRDIFASRRDISDWDIVAKMTMGRGEVSL